MRKAIAVLCALALLSGLFVSMAEEPALCLEMTDTYRSIYEQSAEEEVTLLRPFLKQVDSVEKRELPLYVFEETSDRTLSLYFLNGVTDVPFLDARDLKSLLNDMAAGMQEDSVLYSADASGPILTLYRENGSEAMIDFYGQTVTFTDMNRFSQKAEAVNPVDCVVTGEMEKDEVNLLGHMEVFYRSGGVCTVRLSDYGIPLFLRDGAGYIPLQTVSDLFLSPWNIAALFNGDCVILANDILLVQTGLGDLYFAGEKGTKSPELAAFAYDELCMTLDLFYGLKEEHRISDFDSYFIRTGLAGKLLTRDPEVMADGLAELCIMHFCDGHSALSVQSCRLEKDLVDILMTYFLGPQLTRLTNQKLYMTERMKYYPDGVVPGYEEVGDTAYITFDAFVMDMERDYYASETENNPGDVIELLMYANRQIRRENSPVRNVVLDLSMNSGGQIDAAVSVASWFLGMCDLAIQETTSGAFAINRYVFDANADHTVDPDADSLTEGYRLFCLISPNSFSCGNMVPAVFKADGRVTLLGRRSGGGACAVRNISTADGFLLNISGNIKLSTMNNGIYYSVDEGVDPDIVLTDLSHLYDREYLTEYLDALP